MGVAFLHSVPAGIVAAIFIIIYQQVENHVLQPVIYGRMDYLDRARDRDCGERADARDQLDYRRA